MPFPENKCSLGLLHLLSDILSLATSRQTCFLSWRDVVLGEKFHTIKVQETQGYDLEAITRSETLLNQKCGKGRGEKSGIVGYFVYKSRHGKLSHFQLPLKQ